MAQTYICRTCGSTCFLDSGLTCRVVPVDWLRIQGQVETALDALLDLGAGGMADDITRQRDAIQCLEAVLEMIPDGGSRI